MFIRSVGLYMIDKIRRVKYFSTKIIKTKANKMPFTEDYLWLWK